MISRMMLAGAACLAALGVTGAALAQGLPDQYPVYSYAFYSDASKTTLVGTGETICSPGGDPEMFQLSGSYSNHYSKDLQGVCRDGIIIYQ